MADRENYIVHQEEKGSINISEDVILSIVKEAISEVEGFSGFSTTAGAEIAGLVGLKSIPKGIKVRFEEDKIIVDAIVTVSYGCNIVDVAKNIQSAGCTAVQSMSGIENVEFNVHVAGISF